MTKGPDLPGVAFRVDSGRPVPAGEDVLVQQEGREKGGEKTQNHCGEAFVAEFRTKKV